MILPIAGIKPAVCHVTLSYLDINKIAINKKLQSFLFSEGGDEKRKSGHRDSRLCKAIRDIAFLKQILANQGFVSRLKIKKKERF